MCTGDIGFASAKTYDIEVWAPGHGTLARSLVAAPLRRLPGPPREASATVPTPGDAPQYVHTLNGSGLPAGRVLDAILETYQQPDGSVLLPPALHPYMGGLRRMG